MTGVEGAITAGGANGPDSPHYCEAAAVLQSGPGFFRPESRPSRDLGVLLAGVLAGNTRPAAAGELAADAAAVIAAERATEQAKERAAEQAMERSRVGPLSVLDLMAGCGIRALRYGLEAGAGRIWANDADADRLPWLQRNLDPLRAQGIALRCSARTAQKLLARCLLAEQRFDLLDLDAFGCPAALVPPALEALQFGGVLYLASTDGRSPTGHDRRAAIRSLGAAARAHPASWELALRLQIAVVARTAWAQGHGIRPLFSFSEGRTFRTAIQLRRRPQPREEEQLGLLAHCHRCGEQFSQSLLRLRGWPACGCGAAAGAQAPPLAISGPLWLGPLQHAPTLAAMQQRAETLPHHWCAPASRRLLAALLADPGLPAHCWPTADLGRRLGGGPPASDALIQALRAAGFSAERSGLMAGYVRSNAPWPRVLELAAALNR